MTDRRKQIGRHFFRVLRVATCPCGIAFDVTTRHPLQRYCCRACFSERSTIAQHFKRRETRDRQLQKMAETFAERRRFTESSLLDLLRTVDSTGWHRGYNAGRRSVIPPTAQEWWRKRKDSAA